MQVKKILIPVSRPMFFIQGELPIEEDSPELQSKDLASRLTLQVLAEEIWHDASCSHCYGYDLNDPNPDLDED